MFGLTKIAEQVNNSLELQNYYNRMIDAANQMGIVATPDTDWEEEVTRLLPLLESQKYEELRRNLFERRMRSEELNQDNRISRYLSKPREWYRFYTNDDSPQSYGNTRKLLSEATRSFLEKSRTNPEAYRDAILDLRARGLINYDNVRLPSITEDFDELKRYQKQLFDMASKGEDVSSLLPPQSSLKRTNIGDRVNIGGNVSVNPFENPLISRNNISDGVFQRITGSKHIHPTFDGQRYLNYQLSQALKGIKDYVNVNGKRESVEDPSNPVRIRDLARLSSNNPQQVLPSNYLLYRHVAKQFPDLDFKQVVNTMNRMYDVDEADVNFFANMEDLPSKNITHNIYNPDTGFQSSTKTKISENSPNKTVRKLNSIIFAHEPQNRESSAYQAFQKFYGKSPVFNRGLNEKTTPNANTMPNANTNVPKIEKPKKVNEQTNNSVVANNNTPKEPKYFTIPMGVAGLKKNIT